MPNCCYTWVKQKGPIPADQPFLLFRRSRVDRERNREARDFPDTDSRGHVGGDQPHISHQVAAGCAEVDCVILALGDENQVVFDEGDLHFDFLSGLGKNRSSLSSL